MNDVEINTTHLKFNSLQQTQIITIRNLRRTNINVAFRVYNTQNYEIQPNKTLIKPNEQQNIKVKLKHFDDKDDFFYIKVDNQDVRIQISFEKIDEIKKSIPSSPGFQQSFEQHLDTFGNQRSEQFLSEENKILHQRIAYLTQQNVILNEALDQFMNSEVDGKSLQQLVENLIEQERQDNEYRSQRVLLMIEEKDREIQDLRDQLYNSTQKKDLQIQNEKLQQQIQEYQARENYYKNYQNEEIQRLTELVNKQNDRESYVALYRKYENLVDKYTSLDKINRSLNEEVEIMAQKIDLTQSQVSQVSETRDQLVNRLNARITQLKLREEQLLEENAELEDRLLDKINQQPQKQASKHKPDDLFIKEVQILEKANKDLQHRLTEELNINRNLEKRLDEQTKENGLLNEDIWKLQRENEKYKQEVKKVREQDDYLKKEKLELESQVYAIEQTLKQTSQQEIREQTKQKIDKEISKLKQTHQAEIELIEDENKKFKQLVLDLKQENNILQKQNQQYVIQVEKYQQIQKELESQSRELELQNQKLIKQNQSINIDMEKAKTELFVFRDRNDQEQHKREINERQLQDKIILLQDQINNILKEKQSTQTDIQGEIQKLCKQHQQTVDQLLRDNKLLEQECIQLQSEVGQQKLGFTQREDQLIKEVRNMQDRIEVLLRDQKAKRKEKGKRSDSLKDTNKSLFEPLEEERKRVDVYMNKVKELESELNKVRQQKMQLEYDIQHLKNQQSFKLQIPQNNNQIIAQTSEELKDLKDTLGELRTEREKVISQLMSKDDEIRSLEEQIQEYGTLVQSQQHAIEQLEIKVKSQEKDFNKQLDKRNIELQKIKVELTEKEEQLSVFQQQTKHLQNERREFSEKCYFQGFEMDQIKQNYSEIDSQRQTQISELKQKLELILRDHQENVDLIDQLNKSIVNQKDIYEEIIQRQQNVIDLAREKFIIDLQELMAKQNQYFNQTENIKKSLNPQKETQFINIIQQYSDNVVKSVQMPAHAKVFQDKNKLQNAQIATLKSQLKEATDNILKQQQEIVQLQKKVEKFRPKIGGTKRSEKPEPQNQIQPQEGGITIVLQEAKLLDAEQRCTYLKSQLQLTDVSIEQLNQVNRQYEIEIKKLQQQMSTYIDSVKVKEQIIQDLQKQHKQDNQKIIQEMTQVQNKFVPEDKLLAQAEIIKDREQTIKELRDELVRKRDVADQFRSDRDEKQQQYDKLKKQYDDLKDEYDKYKLKVKDQDRQQNTLKEFKEKYEQMKQSEKVYQNDIAKLEERNKQQKQDLQRKEQMVKDLKEKQEQMSQIKPNDQENKDLKAEIKKLKDELNRKDSSIKHYKQKFDEKVIESDNYRNDFTLKYSQTVQELERELKKNEQIKINQKKQENQVNMLLFLLKRIYRENYMQLHKSQPKQRQSSTNKQLAKFSESLNILNLAPEDLDDFLEPNQSTSTIKKFGNKDLERFEQECSNPDQIDPNAIYNMINNIIQERINS